MEKSKDLKSSKEEFNKYCIPCINFKECQGKWFKYKFKDDNGFCKTCIKKDYEKSKDIKKDSHFN